jgi:hypothetical protein
MEFLGRFAIALSDLPSLLRAWPQMQAAVASGALMDVLLVRRKLARPWAESMLRGALLLVILEIVVGFMLAFFQAYFYWSPK